MLLSAFAITPAQAVAPYVSATTSARCLVPQILVADCSAARWAKTTGQFGMDLIVRSPHDGLLPGYGIQLGTIAITKEFRVTRPLKNLAIRYQVRFDLGQVSQAGPAPLPATTNVATVTDALEVKFACRCARDQFHTLDPLMATYRPFPDSFGGRRWTLEVRWQGLNVRPGTIYATIKLSVFVRVGDYDGDNMKIPNVGHARALIKGAVEDIRLVA